MSKIEYRLLLIYLIIVMFFRKSNISDSNNYNFNTRKQKSLNYSRMNSVATVSNLLKGKYLVGISKKTRFPRQVKKIFNTNNRKESYERPFKVVLDLKSENQEDYYDYYDNDKYNNYQGRNIKGLVDDWNLNSEVEKNSKPITKTLCESQERKRCSIMKSVNKLDFRKIEQPQQLVSKNIDSERKPELRCRDCKLLKSNASPIEPKISNVKTNQLNQINDDSFITILKQLIDKLDKSKNLKYSNNNLPILKSSEPIILENKPVEQKTLNDSSEEEWILKLEKMKRNRIMDKLNSSPENTYINGKWLKNQIAVNKKNDCEPVVNEFSMFNGKNESTSSNSDTKQLNFTNAENQVTESDGDTSKSMNSLATISTQKITEVSTLPLPAENHNLEASKETAKPLYLSTEPIHELDAAMIDENDQLLKYTTTEINNSNFSNLEENYTNPDEPTVNIIYTTPKESNEGSTSESNNELKTQNLNRILEPDVQHKNDNPKNTNHSEGVANADESDSFEKENYSSENNCNCNKKVIKNILSSTMISNITEIKTDTYSSPTRTKTKSHKRSDRKLTNNGAINEALNSPSKISEKDPNSSSKIIKEDPIKVNTLPVSTLIIDDDQSLDKIANNKENTKTSPKKSSFAKDTVLSLNGEPLKYENQRRNKNEEKININTKDIRSKTATYTPKNSRQFFAKPKPVVPQKTGIDFEEADKIDKFNTNKKPFSVSKSPVQRSRKVVINRTTSPRSIKNETGKHGGNIAKKTPGIFATKSNHNFPKNPRIHVGKNVSDKSIIVDDVTTTKKPFSAVKSFSRSSTKTVQKPPSKTVSRQWVDITRHDDENVKNVVKTPKGKIGDRKKISFQNDSDRNNMLSPAVRLRKPQGLIGNVDKTKVPTNGKNINGLTSKRPTNEAKTGTGSFPSFAANYENPTDERGDSPSALNGKYVLNDQQSLQTTGPDSVRGIGSERDFKSNGGNVDSDVLRRSKLAAEDRFADEHGPYRAEDLKPIVFDAPAEKRAPTAKNAAAHGVAHRPVAGAGPQSFSDQTNSKPVPIVRPEPEYDDYYDYYDAWKHTDEQVGSSDRGDGGDGALAGIPKDKHAAKNGSGFEAPLPVLVNVIDGVQSGALIPIETADGRRATISLAKLLTGDLRPAGVTRVLAGNNNASSGDGTLLGALRELRGGSDGTARTAPAVQIVQIINSGACSGGRPLNGIGGGEKPRSSQKTSRNGSKRVLQSPMTRTSRLQSAVPNRIKLGKAYEHFDSEILDKFLQVYAPPHEV